MLCDTHEAGVFSTALGDVLGQLCALYQKVKEMSPGRIDASLDPECLERLRHTAPHLVFQRTFVGAGGLRRSDFGQSPKFPATNEMDPCVCIFR